MLRRAWEKFPFDHEDIFFIGIMVVFGVCMLIAAALAMGLAYRVFEVAGGL